MLGCRFSEVVEDDGAAGETVGVSADSSVDGGDHVGVRHVA